MSVPADWVGKIIGKIQVVKKLEVKDKWGSIQWETVCDCGTYLVKTSKRLTQMKKKS